MIYDKFTKFIDRITNNLNFGEYTAYGMLMFVFVIAPICIILVCLDIILLPIETIIYIFRRVK